ncbi:MAG: glycosyltransferase family A protein [Bacteroidota bacterium]
MNNPLVSVIITAFNYEQYIVDAVESVLNQTYRSFELIVVDDGSTDNTRKVLAPYMDHIQYHYQVNQGLSGALNKGITLAKGTFIAFLDADDLWLPHKLSLQVNTFCQQPAIDIVFGHLDFFYSPELSSLERSQLSCPDSPKPGFFKACMILKKSIFKEVGCFEESQVFGEFLHWFQKVKDRKIGYLMLPKVVAKRRIHGKNMTIVHKKAYHQDLLALVRKRRNSKVHTSKDDNES